MNQQKRNYHVPLILGLIALAIALLFTRVLAFLIPTVLVPVIFIVTLHYAYISWKRENGAPEDEMTQEINELSKKCVSEKQKLRKMINKIIKSKNELERSLSKNKNLQVEDDLINQTSKLIADYEMEEKVIRSKLTFYEELEEQITVLKKKVSWKRSLEKKKKDLADLKEGHYDDVEQMEILKQDVAHTSGVMESLNELSRELKDLNTSADIELLRRELEKVRIE